MSWSDFLLILTAAISFSTPLILAAMGELIVERAGIVNIGIEGMMLAGALGAYWVASIYGPVAGLLGAIVFACVLVIPFIIATLFFAADQIVTGTGINLLSLGLTGMIYNRIAANMNSNVAGLDKSWMLILTGLLTVMVIIFVRYTRAGLGLIAIGESRDSARSAGVAVRRYQACAILFGALTAGLAGAYSSIVYTRSFIENMIDGAGFLALAIVIFGRWKPTGVIVAGLFFGLIRAVANHLETKPGFSPMMLRSFSMLPYVISLAALAGLAGKSHAPAELGRN